VYGIRDISGLGHSIDPEYMDQYPGHGDHEQQENEDPVTVMGKLEDLLFLPEPADEIVDGGKEQPKGHVIPQQSLGMGGGVDFIGLKPFQEDNDQGKHDQVAGHDQHMAKPIDLFPVTF
jgi:hypothetical protein